MSLTPTTLDENETYVIYMATAPSGKKYIGKTIKSFKRRKSAHIYEANLGYDRPFHRAIRKYGEDIKWEILEKCKSDEELRNRECYYIEKYEAYTKGYNCTLGGEGHAGYKQSEETIAKRNKAISKANMGRKHSKQTKNKMSKAKLGNTNRLGKKCSKETKDKISKIQNSKKRAIICIETKIIFESITETAKQMNICKANLQKHLSDNPKYKSYKSISGYTFKFEEIL